MFILPHHMRGLFLKSALLALLACTVPMIAHGQGSDLIIRTPEGTPAGAPNAPLVTSQVFHDSDAWYGATSRGSFQWELPDDVTAVAANIVSDTETEPTFVYEPAVANFTPDMEELQDGVQYLAVQFKNEIGWGAISYHKLQIDRTPPSSLLVDMLPTARPGLSDFMFSATDELSGIAGYTLYQNGNGPVFVTPQQAQNGYPFAHASAGTVEVLVFAHDHAGNSISNHFPVFVLDREMFETEGPLGLSLTREEISLLGLCALSLLALWFAVHTIMRSRRKERKIREEMYEVQDQMGKIFAALRDEIYDQVQSLNSRKRLSKGEQRIVTDLNKVLEVSETLVAKEVQDVKKLLK